MPTPAERMAVLMEVHGDSLRAASERCGLDHTTILRIRNGETENPATLERVAEGYGVPLRWLQGRPDLPVDFTMAVLARPLDERKRFLWDRSFRFAFALRFLRSYCPETYTFDRLAALVGSSPAQVAKVVGEDSGHLMGWWAARGLRMAGIPAGWLETGLLGHPMEEPMLLEMAEQALRRLAQAVGATVDDEDIRLAARALV